MVAQSSGRRSGARRAVGLGAGGAAAVMLLTGCDIGKTFDGFGWPQGGISEQSQRMYDVWIGSTVAALLVGILVWGLIFWCVVRYKKRGDELPPQTRFNLPIEILYTVLPVLVVSVLFYYTAIVQTDVDELSSNPDETVEVIAAKWNWQFNYRTAPGEEASTVASELGTDNYIPVLVVPTGRTVLFEMNAADVIHSFWVPELLFKRDVFPGNVRNKFEVTIDQEGAYVGRCAELCGTYHSMMNFELRAVSGDDFDRYLEAKRAGQSTPQALQSIGQEPYAVTTEPFDTARQQGDAR